QCLEEVLPLLLRFDRVVARHQTKTDRVHFLKLARIARGVRDQVAVGIAIGAAEFLILRCLRQEGTDGLEFIVRSVPPGVEHEGVTTRRDHDEQYEQSYHAARAVRWAGSRWR